MKLLLTLVLALSSSLSFANEEAIKKLDSLFDLRIKANEDYRDQFTAEAKEIESKEAREFLVKSEKKLGQDWVEFLKKMKTNPDLTLRVQLLRLEIIADLNTGYYDLEYAEGFTEKVKARKAIMKWANASKELDAAEKLLKKTPKTKKKE